jgi:hypothetical protein
MVTPTLPAEAFAAPEVHHREWDACSAFRFLLGGHEGLRISRRFAPIASRRPLKSAAMPVSHEDHGGVPMTVSVALGHLDQFFNHGGDEQTCVHRGKDDRQVQTTPALKLPSCFATQGPRQDDRCAHSNEAFSVSTCYEPLLRFALLEHRFEFIFKRSRRNSKFAKSRQLV